VVRFVKLYVMKILEMSSLENIQGGGNSCGSCYNPCDSISATLALALSIGLGGCGCGGLVLGLAAGVSIHL
jgi:hypothetical protein